MNDEKSLVLPEAASRALVEFAERIGREPQELAAEAIERFIADEEPIAEAVLQGLESLRNGRSIPHEEVVRHMQEVIHRADRKRA